MQGCQSTPVARPSEMWRHTAVRIKTAGQVRLTWFNFKNIKNSYNPKLLNPVSCIAVWDILPNFIMLFQLPIKVYYSQLSLKLFSRILSSKNQWRKCKSLRIPSGPAPNIWIRSKQQFLQSSTCAAGKYEMEINLLYVSRLALHLSDSSLVAYLSLSITNLHVFSFKVSQHGGR